MIFDDVRDAGDALRIAKGALQLSINHGAATEAEAPRRVRRPTVLSRRPRRGRRVDGSGRLRVRRVGCRRRPRIGGGG